MKMFLLSLVSALALVSTAVDAKGGFSGGGGRSFSAPSRSYSAPISAPRPAPSVAPPTAQRAPVAPPPQAAPQNAQRAPVAAPPPVNAQRAPVASPPSTVTAGNRGGFSGSPAQGARTTTTTTTTQMTTRTAGGGFVSAPVMYGGFGMGFGYTNGLLTGLIIGNMLHPHHTVMYTGPGMYANNALLYPDGRVVTNQGVHVGNYTNGTYTAVSGGRVVAQPAPADAIQSAPAYTPAPQPVILKPAGPSPGEIFLIIFLVLMVIIVFGMTIHRF